MLKLNASYSKKVPGDEQFSSQSFLASIEVELPHGMTSRELQDKIHDTFDLVKTSVENELSARTASAAPVPQSRPEAPAATSAATATNKQIGYILKLGKEHQKGLPELNEMAHSLFKAESIYQLTKRDASALVDQLKMAA
jgi:hypothetical protein